MRAGAHTHTYLPLNKKWYNSMDSYREETIQNSLYYTNMTNDRHLKNWCLQKGVQVKKSKPQPTKCNC